jgi:toxin CcdB
MARFDVYRQDVTNAYLLDCQADSLSMLNTRFVAPLLSPDDGPLPIAHLNPAFRIGEDLVIMYTQFAASVPARELGACVATLTHEDRTIMNALDMLITGY